MQERSDDTHARRKRLRGSGSGVDCALCDCYASLRNKWNGNQRGNQRMILPKVLRAFLLSKWPTLKYEATAAAMAVNLNLSQKFGTSKALPPIGLAEGGYLFNLYLQAVCSII